MWKDSLLSRRIGARIGLVLALGSLMTCASDPQRYADRCKPEDNKEKPRICVDNVGVPAPKTARAWDETSFFEWQVKVRWIAQNRDAILKVDFENEDCVKKEDVNCTGAECTAKIRKIDWDDTKPDDQEKRDCKYKTTITIDGKTIDPDGELVVNPCCM